MKIAIANNLHEAFFTNHWICYCEEKGIEYHLVNPYDNNIVEQLKEFDAFMWHHSNYDYRDALFAKQLIYSVEKMGLRVFPDFNTTWHFDDKVGEMYLLRAIGAPIVPSYVFYDKKEAIIWAKQTSYPKVFKLRGGSGSTSVKLVKTTNQAKKLIRKSFSSRGFRQIDWWGRLRDRIKAWFHGRDSLLGVCKSLVWCIIRNDYDKLHPNEKGYAYFQDFIPNNDSDLRVVVIGDKAMGEKRLCREGDFRASGSGRFEYVPLRDDVLKIAFQTAQRLQLQSVAFDFIFNENKPLIVEMSYGFGTHGLAHCPGYYTSDLKWHEEFEPNFWGWMIEELIENENTNN